MSGEPGKERHIRVVGLSGSLRRASFNTAALRAAVKLAPEGMTIVQAEIGHMPHYNEDLRSGDFPQEVAVFRDMLSNADAILLVTPEYNYSIPGVLKNAIDWASRKPGQPFDGKPVAIMGASRGMLGTCRAQYQLRQMLVCLNSYPVNKPEVMIGNALQKFDEDGNLIDEVTRDFIRELLNSLRDWVKVLRSRDMCFVNPGPTIEAVGHVERPL